MTVCRYFQQGNCRYGASCRYEHSFPSKYVYQAPASVSPNQFIQLVADEVDAALKGNQWLLSCYAPFKGKPNFPGLVDYSMEEIRLMMYDAMANGSGGHCVSDLSQLNQSFHTAYKLLGNQSELIKNQLEMLYKGNLPNSSFSIIPPDWSNRNLTFGSGNEQPVNIHSPSNFGTNSFTAPQPHTFNSSNVSVSPSDLFASASNKLYGSNSSPENIFASAVNARNIFASANQNQPNSSVFNQANTNIFQQVNTNVFQQEDLATKTFQQSNIFQNQATFNQASGDVFGKSSSYEVMESSNDPFNQQSSSNLKNSVFGSNTSTDNSARSLFQSANQALFGSSFAAPIEKQDEDDEIYSKKEELSTEDIGAYNCETFAIGHIPELPPTYGLCYS